MANETLDGSAVKAVAELAHNAAAIIVHEIETPDGLCFPVALRAVGGGKFEQINVFEEADDWRDAPIRREGVAKAFTLASFIDLVNRHKDDGSAVFASILTDEPKFVAVIDYHTKNHEPRFGRHRAVYKFPISNEWKAWKGKNGSAITQADFAAWIENHIADLASPCDAEKSLLEPLMQTMFATPADLMRLARGLQINVESKVGQVVNLQTGEGQIQWEEAHKDSDGKPLKVPGLFIVSIPLFVGGEVMRLPARLRYRKDGGKLNWWFNLYRWEEVFRAALQNDLDRVGKETALPVYEGEPEE